MNTIVVGGSLAGIAAALGLGSKLARQETNIDLALEKWEPAQRDLGRQWEMEGPGLGTRSPFLLYCHQSSTKSPNEFSHQRNPSFPEPWIRLFLPTLSVEPSTTANQP